MKMENKDYRKEEIEKIFEEHKPSRELMNLQFRDYGKEGIALMDKLWEEVYSKYQHKDKDNEKI